MHSVTLEDGEILEMKALYIRPPMVQACPDLLEQLGVELDDKGYIVVDDNQKTNVEGVMACGDCTTANRAVSIAVASGTIAAKMLNYELSIEDWTQ